MRRALLIGVARYDRGYDERVGPSVRHDVELMDRLLRGLGWSIGATLGADGEAVGKEDIEDAVAALLDDAGDDDEVLVYFSGHGRRREGAITSCRRGPGRRTRPGGRSTTSSTSPSSTPCGTAPVPAR